MMNNISTLDYKLLISDFQFEIPSLKVDLESWVTRILFQSKLLNLMGFLCQRRQDLVDVESNKRKVLLNFLNRIGFDCR